MKKVIIIRYAELFLKGKNRGFFERAFEKNIERALEDIAHRLVKQCGRKIVHGCGKLCALCGGNPLYAGTLALDTEVIEH